MMKVVCKILTSVLAAVCLFKVVQLLIDFFYDKYGKRYIQADEIE